MRGRPLKIDWHEDAATLKQLFLKQTDPELRPRLHALWLVREGRSIGAVAPLLAVHYDTVQRWLRWYRQAGLSAVLNHRHGGRQGVPARLTAAQQQALLADINQGQFHTAEDIKRHLAAKYQAHYRRSGVYSLLRRLRVKKKVPRPHALKADDQAQAGWKKGG